MKNNGRKCDLTFKRKVIPLPAEPAYQMKVEGAAAPSVLIIVPGGVYGGNGAIFASGNPISQSKNRFLAVSAPGNP